MVYYGTSNDSARASGIDAMTARVREAFPGIEVREAYTSRAAVNALKRHKGIRRPLLRDALTQLSTDGYNSVLVVDGDIIEGKSSRNMQQLSRDYYQHFFELKATTPLLYTPDDFRKALTPLLALADPQPDEELVFVGHGRDGAYNDAYCLADYVLQHEGHPNCHVATISGYPSLDNIKQILARSGRRKVVLVPLIMIEAGHATKDIYKTWREALEKEGYSVRLVRHGVREYPEIQQLIIDKIQTAVQQP